MASLSRFVLLNIVGAEPAVNLAGGPLGGKSIVGAKPGLVRLGVAVVGVLVGCVDFRWLEEFELVFELSPDPRPLV